MSDAKWEPNREEYVFLEQQLQEARKEITRLRRKLRWCEEVIANSPRSPHIIMVPSEAGEARHDQ